MSVACPLSLRKLPRMRTTVDGQPPRNTRIATPSNLSKPPPETVHYQGRTPVLCPHWVKLDRRGQSRMVIYVSFAPKADKVGDKAPGPICAMNGSSDYRSHSGRDGLGQ